jgi:hypothetical protein
MSGTLTRPIGVTVIAILLVVSAIANIIMGFMFIFSSFGDNPTYINNITGESATVSGFFLWFNGGMLIILGLIYFWLSKLAWVGSNTAQVIISVLAVLNIIFGFFNLGHGGWIQVILGLIVVLIVNTKHAQAWFRQYA